MKILCIGNYPLSADGHFTGPMRVLYNLAEALAGLPDTKVTVMTPHRMRSLFRKPEHFGWGRADACRVSYLDMRFRMGSDYDVINSHGVSVFNTFPLLNRQYREIPFIFTAHGLVVREKDLGYHYASHMLRNEHKLITGADRITTVSEDTRRLIAESYPVDETRIEIIENGVDTDDFFPLAAPAPGGKSRILFAGDLLPVKGLDFLLQAVSLAGDAPFVLQIAGSPTPYFTGLQSAYSPLFESGRIQMLGRLNQEALKKTYSEADFLILTSRYEQCPQVMLEAMSMGKPVIISDRVGSRKMVLQGGGGFVVEFGDAAMLKQKILSLVHNPALKKELGKKARATALAYTWTRVAARYRSLFQRVCDEKFS